VTEDIESSSTQPTADAARGAADSAPLESRVAAEPTVDGASAEADSVPLQARVAALADDRPEVAVAAAFAGGLVVALILKRLVH
jgi:hypothetical protein